MTAESIKSGLTAGFVASAVLGILMILKSRLGILPDLDPIHDIVAIADQYTGLQFPPDLGWVGHFFIGTIVWGLLYACKVAIQDVVVCSGARLLLNSDSLRLSRLSRY